MKCFGLCERFAPSLDSSASPSKYPLCIISESWLVGELLRTLNPKPQLYPAQGPVVISSRVQSHRSPGRGIAASWRVVKQESEAAFFRVRTGSHDDEFLASPQAAIL